MRVKDMNIEQATLYARQERDMAHKARTELSRARHTANAERAERRIAYIEDLLRYAIDKPSMAEALEICFYATLILHRLDGPITGPSEQELDCLFLAWVNREFPCSSRDMIVWDTLTGPSEQEIACLVKAWLPLEFWSVREDKASIRVYGKGASISHAVGSAIDTLHRLHPDREGTQCRILNSLVSTLPSIYWRSRVNWTNKEIIDLTEEE